MSPERPDYPTRFGQARFRLRRIAWAFGLFGACLGTARLARAQALGPEAESSDLSAYKQMSLSDLMSLDVTSVSLAPQPYGDAPAAIQVITNDEIIRSGASSIPEALRLADGLDVAQENSHDWAISARGFDANLGNKLLVLIDGRAIYTPLYGGVLWNTQDYLLEDIDRIEVVSGPGGTLWGANAVNGVINITTKSAKDTQGLYAEAGGGSSLEDFEALRYGGTLAPNVYYRVYAKYDDRASEVLPDGADADDTYVMGQGGFRIDAYPSPENTWTVQGDHYNGGEDEGATGDARFNGDNLLGRWTDDPGDGSESSLQAYYDRTYLAQPFGASPPSPPYYTGFPAASLIDQLYTYDVEFQRHLRAGGRHKIVWGLGYRFTHESDEDLSTVRFLPPDLDQNLYSGFAQDEIALEDDLSLTVGSKVEHNDYTGFEFEPSTRLQWNPASRQMVWAAVSRAVRTPSRYDRDLEVASGLVNAPAPYQFPAAYLAGNPDFVSETVIAYELGYRAELGPSVSTSVSAYYNDYDDLRSTSATPTTATYVFPYPVFFQNNLEGDTDGAEVSADWQVLPRWRLHAGYDLLQEHLFVRPGEVSATGANNETADPRHQWDLRSSMDLPGRIDLDAALRGVGALTIDDGPTGGLATGTVPAYVELDARLAWRATGRLELSVVGDNLLHDRHQEYGYPSPTTEEIERSVYGEAAWHY